MLEAVLFDMDGVIVDSEPLHERVCRRMFEGFGLDLSREEYNSFIGSTNTKMWGFFKEKYDLKEAVEELIGRHEGEVFRDFIEGNEKPIPGISELLRELGEAGIKMAIASSSARYAIEIVLGKFNMKDYFHAIISGEELERPKPAPDIFLIAAEHLGVCPEKCVVIEDSQNGVKAARAAGMKCIGFNSGGAGIQDVSMADVVVEGIREINLKLLKGLARK